MAAGPALHIFPPVEEANKRRESLDDLIRRSMDMRPTGPWTADNHARINNKSQNTWSPQRSHNNNLMPGDPTHVGVAITRDRSPSPAHERVKILPPIIEAKSSPRENLFQKLPPIQVPKRNPSVARGGRPRRSSSVGSRAGNRSATSPARQRVPSPSDYYRKPQEPFQPGNEVYQTPISAVTPIVVIERDIPSRSSNRGRVCMPRPGIDGGEVAHITSPIYHHPLQMNAIGGRGPSKALSRQPLQRHIPPHVQHGANFPPSPDRHRLDTSVPSPDSAGISPSTTLVRAGSLLSQKQWTPVSPMVGTPILTTPQSDLPMRSIFPVFNPTRPLSQQSYRPQFVAPIAVISPEQITRPIYSPSFDSSLLLPNKKLDEPYITPANDLASLWATANGKMTAPDPKSFTLKMFHLDAAKGKQERLVFGPAEDQPFYALSKVHTMTEEGEEHELLIQRHHMTDEDILPVSHLELHPPPPPTLSRPQRASILSDVHTPAQHVATIMPILATLHALDSAAKTQQAHTIALVDPNATSPAAQKLAERAVKEATERESCTLAWTATDPRSGKYELHHPSLGVFTINAVGDIKSAVEQRVVKGLTQITIMNPYASLSPLSNNSPLSNSSPISVGSTASTAINQEPEEPEVFARLDFQQGTLHLDAASIQQLGNLYLIDVCVSALLSVAIAEAKRPEDPGLVFDAPPPSLLSVKATSKKIKPEKIKSPRVREVKEISKPKKRRSPRPITIMANSLGLGFEHLADEQDLPRITKAILGLLGFSFKSAVYLLGMGVKVTAAIVIGITKMATKD